MPETSPLHLFDAVGIELEYMIVDADRLDVLPVCDQVMAAETGETTSEVEFADITWNNELVLHVIELKTSLPVVTLAGLDDAFGRHLARVRAQLEPLGGTLMPTAMHPWMDPHTETRLWPHECNAIYETFHRIFDCRGHGWSNLQALHINLPFSGDEEFGRLHAAIRLLMPILPALAASSPIVAGRATGSLDNRLEAYRVNCARIPSVTGRVVPEPVFTTDEYRGRILQRIYDDLRPHDPEGVVLHEWANARGAIARLDRGSIEIRVLDVQECPAADLAISAVVVAVLKLIAAETWSTLAAQQAWPVEPLADLFDTVVRGADQAAITNRDYLQSLGWPGQPGCTAVQLWRHLIDTARARDPAAFAGHDATLDLILDEGPVARRILRALKVSTAPDPIRRIYTDLCRCLADGRMFGAGQ